ncbi:unnamed protein product, partial [Pleuronectes platessa]
MTERTDQKMDSAEISLFQEQVFYLEFLVDELCFPGPTSKSETLEEIAVVEAWLKDRPWVSHFVLVEVRDRLKKYLNPLASSTNPYRGSRLAFGGPRSLKKGSAQGGGRWRGGIHSRSLSLQQHAPRSQPHPVPTRPKPDPVPAPCRRAPADVSRSPTSVVLTAASAPARSPVPAPVPAPHRKLSADVPCVSASESLLQCLLHAGGSRLTSSALEVLPVPAPVPGPVHAPVPVPCQRVPADDTPVEVSEAPAESAPVPVPCQRVLTGVAQVPALAVLTAPILVPVPAATPVPAPRAGLRPDLLASDPVRSSGWPPEELPCLAPDRPPGRPQKPQNSVPERPRRRPQKPQNSVPERPRRRPSEPQNSVPERPRRRPPKPQNSVPEQPRRRLPEPQNSVPERPRLRPPERRNSAGTLSKSRIPSSGSPLLPPVSVLVFFGGPSAQFLIFVRWMTKDFDFTEELAAMRSIKETTTGSDVFTE